MDLLRYSDTVLTVCFKDKSRREINDILRQLYSYRDRMRVCPCIKDTTPPTEISPWVRETLTFLGAQFNNEPSHKSP